MSFLAAFTDFQQHLKKIKDDLTVEEVWYTNFLYLYGFNIDKKRALPGNPCAEPQKTNVMHIYSSYFM